MRTSEESSPIACAVPGQSGEAARALRLAGRDSPLCLRTHSRTPCDAAFYYIKEYVIRSPQTMESLVKEVAIAQFAADVIGGAIGVFIVWRLALALKKP